ncbi:phage major capsid protein [Variovorax sp. KBS0712]|uniref:phage major capsid protein n=1 Tax=Variovorax sp. KBS0712 TaxID=2578111 RepID=UPI0011182644|nr:phage major capsid protein [Variovorax sp. KBS0712]TSD59865.1 phage major capsid protein [Variovorax sp. KBS0712]
MKITRKHFVIAILATLAVLAAFTLLGHPVIPPEALAGFGMLPLAAGPVSMEEVANILDTQGKAFKSFIDRNDAERDELKAAIDELQKKAGRPNMGGSGGFGGSAGTPAELKAMEGAFRALITGDKAKADQLFVEAKAMSAGSGPEGGYMVQTQFSSGFTKVMAEISPVFRLARVIDLDAGTDGFEEPIDRDTADATWVGEQSARPETGTPDLGMFYVPVDEIYAMPKTTQKLLDVSSLNIMSWLQTKVGEAFGSKESAAFHAGDGIAKPRGILSYATAATADASRAWGTIQHIATGSSGAFPTTSSTVNPADKLIDMITAMKPQYRKGAVWLMNRNTASVVRKFKDVDGRYVWSDSLLADQPATLLGYPVEIDEDMPDIGADTLSVAFANLNRAYTIVQKPGIKFLPDPYTAKPHVLLYSYRRVGGAMNNSEAVKLLKFGTS